MDTVSAGDEPPTYSSIYDAVNSSVRVQDDGRIAVDLDSKLYRTLSFLERSNTIRNTAVQSPAPEYSENGPESIRLNIVIQVVGSRGDVQPFIALGCELLKHGHRVRIATHGVFRDFVLKSGLEFFNIAGDPTELMAYMVKNPGLIPSVESLRAGDIQSKKRMMAEMLRGCWSSCVSPDPVTSRPFVAEAIIANPPSFAYIHCAQALGIPVHLMFTMPWTSTVEFSHPLANIVNYKGSRKTARETANYLSYLVIEWMTWQGLGDVVNTWRGTLGLEEIDFSEGPLLAETLMVPFTYCWSPSLVPKPKDWGNHIDVCGFFFREAPLYEPESDLDTFLRSGDPPVYIGFGSIVINCPAELTNLILESVKAAGVRAIISKGWSNLGTDCYSDHDVFFLGDCPHEWLFQHVSAVVHHGGAGTTACGLLYGKPTTIIPFFGDQPFWGNMVAAAGAGPAPIPYKQLTTANLTHALRFCQRDEIHFAAKKIAEKMRSESGVRRAVTSFHANLPLAGMRCDIIPDRPAAWLFKKKDRHLKLSKEAAGILVKEGRVAWKNLKRYDTKGTIIDLRRLDPVTASTSSLLTVGSGMAGSAIDIVAKPIQAYNRPKAASTGDATATGHNQSQQEQQEISTYGRSAALDVRAGTGKEVERQPSAFKEAVAGSTAGFGGVLKHFTKGMLDAPLAVTEGFRNSARLYGGKVYEPGRVDGLMSGGIVAGKNMFHGITHGFGGLIISPVKGAQLDGPLGLVKGLGVGCLDMATKVPSGLLGLIFYPGQGMYKSIYTATHRKIRNAVKSARRIESEHLAEQPNADTQRVVQQFDGGPYHY